MIDFYGSIGRIKRLCLSRGCQTTTTPAEVEELLKSVKDEWEGSNVDRADTDAVETFIKEVEQTRLSEFHHFLIKLKSHLVVLYSVRENDETRLNRSILERRVQVCQTVMKYMYHIDPGQTKKMGVFLLELNKPRLRLAKVKFDEGQISRKRYLQMVVEGTQIEAQAKNMIGTYTLSNAFAIKSSVCQLARHSQEPPSQCEMNGDRISGMVWFGGQSGEMRSVQGISILLVIIQSSLAKLVDYDPGQILSLTEIFNLLSGLERNFPQLTSQTLETSYEGRPIKLFKIAQKGANTVFNWRRSSQRRRNQEGKAPTPPPSNSKPALWVDCGIHAREWLSPAFCVYLIHAILVGDSKFLAERFTVFVAPMVNPDGYEYSHEKDRFWRKNRRPMADNPTIKPSGNKTCFGVDPNRNFPQDPIVSRRPRASQNPCSDEYEGRSPFSEAETRFIQKGLGEARDQGYHIKSYVSIHCCTRVLLAPFGLKREKTPHYEHQMSALEAAKEAIEANQGGTPYKFGPTSALLKPTGGGALDWAYSKMGIKFAFAFEMKQPGGPKGKQRFLVDESTLKPTLLATLAGLEAMAEKVLELE
eukprot:maker-scaffold42_size484952-snap-gene-0.10 protein:Tk06355 transcript:maker-scaffold42_size484952-snap-gene-0.10-mRNA-1 annotation:"carboxypeptidase a2 precursor"